MQMLKWYVGKAGNTITTSSGLQIGEGVFVTIYAALLVLIGTVINARLRPSFTV